MSSTIEQKSDPVADYNWDNANFFGKLELILQDLIEVTLSINPLNTESKRMTRIINARNRYICEKSPVNK